MFLYQTSDGIRSGDLDDDELFLPDDIDAGLELVDDLELCLVLVVDEDDADVRELLDQLVQHVPGHALHLLLLQLEGDPPKNGSLVHLEAGNQHG